MIGLEFSIAARYLRAKKKEGFASIVAVFSFIGIMLGVATLIVVMAVMNGVKLELINRIIGINAHIAVNSANGHIDNYQILTQNIAKVKGVTKVNPAVYGQTLASSNGENIGLMVRGIEPDDLAKKTLVQKNIVSGNMYEADSYHVLVGADLARHMGVKPGSKMSLISPTFNQTLFGSIPRLKEFEVSGVFNVGMYEYDSSVVFMPLAVAQKFFALGDGVNTIEIEVNDPKNFAEVKQQIFEMIKDSPYYLTDWREQNASFLESIDVQANVLFLILALIILVAAFNVISGMVMLVNDKNKEIAILRTIGIKRSSIIRIFIICGSAIGVLGTLFGLILGLSFAANIDSIRLWLEGLTGTNLFSAEIYFLSKLPAEIKNSDVVHIVLLSLGLSFLSTIYPAWKASRIQPAEALKYE